MEGVKIILLLAAAVCQISAAPQLMSAALSASGLGAFTGIASLATDTKTIGKALDLGGNVTRFATDMVKNVSESASTVARVGLNHTTGLGSKALIGGVNIGKQGVSLAESAAKHFPGGQVMSIISPAAKAGLDVVGKVGVIGLNVTAKADHLIDTGNRIVQHKAELVNTGVQKFIDGGRKVVNKVDSVKNSLSSLSKLGSKVTSAVSGASSKVTSAVSGASSKVTSAVSGASSKVTSAVSGASSKVMSAVSGASSKVTSAASGVTSANSGGSSSSGGQSTSTGVKGKLSSLFG